MSIRVAIVTGAGSGLGKEVALALCAADHFVVGVSRREVTCPAWGDSVKDGRAHHIAGDVADADTVAMAFECAEARGSLDLVVNCAGQGIFGPVGKYARDDIDKVLQGNLIGTILFSEAAFNRFENAGGTIVNVMSTAAHVARKNEAIYCAAKWGARGYTEALRLEAKGTSAKVIAVYPGGMNTEFWKNAQGVTMDSSKFMSAAEVATVIVDTLKTRDTSYISDIVVNRK